MSRNYTFAPGEYYHLYSRGVEKLSVFRDNKDYVRFLESLYLLNNSQPVIFSNIKKSSMYRGLTSIHGLFDMERGETLVDIGVYCLMPNHFHLLVREKDNGGISKFMQKLMTSYTMYFNKKYDRTGALFGSSFKAQHVTSDNHLKYLFAYIHTNPIKIVQSNWKDVGIKNPKKVKDFIQKFKYSSYEDYTNPNSRDKFSIINKDVFPKYFTSGKDFEDYIELCKEPWTEV